MLLVNTLTHHYFTHNNLFDVYDSHMPEFIFQSQWDQYIPYSFDAKLVMDRFVINYTVSSPLYMRYSTLTSSKITVHKEPVTNQNKRARNFNIAVPITFVSLAWWRYYSHLSLGGVIYSMFDFEFSLYIQKVKRSDKRSNTVLPNHLLSVAR